MRNIKKYKSVNNRIIAILALILSSLSGFAQKIEGIVLNEDSARLGNCTLTLTNISTKKIIKLTATNKLGEYVFENVQIDSFQITVSYVGYTNFKTSVLKAKANETTLVPNIILQKSKNNLNEVVVTAKRQMLEVKADKMVVNVEGTINAVGSDALELIRKAPGVAVDKDDNIQMSGKSGVQIYIDGKPSPLTGEDLANYLKAVQSSQIDALELITNPSAKYEAAGNAGIINIKLKKNKNLGTNGSVQAGYAIGIKPKYNTGFSLNNRTKKINIFSNYNYNDVNNLIDIRFKRTLADTIFDLNAKRSFLNHTHGFKTGIDYTQNKTTTWGVIISGNFNNQNTVANTETPIISRATNIIARILDSKSDQVSQENNINANTNYRYQNKKNQSLNIDADFGNFSNHKNLYQPNTYYSGDRSIKLSEVNYNLLSQANINIYSLKADYEQALAKGTFGIGGKFAFVTSDNNFKFYNVPTTTQKLLDIAKSNQFNYRENVNALYVNYNKSWTNIQLQIGLRGEQTQTSGSSYAIGIDEQVDYNNVKAFKRSYINLFPSMGFSFIKNAKSTWNITAGRRVDRPNYQDLNPFEFKVDEYSSRRGNTDLIPQFSYNVALTHTWNNKLVSKLSYSNVVNLISRLTDTTNGNKSFNRPTNIGTQNLFSIFESYQYQRKWYTGMFTINGYHTAYNADLGGGNRIINNKATAVIITMQNSFKLKYDYTVELNGNYNSPTVNGASQEKMKWGLDIGAQKLILKGQGSIKLSATDIFWTNLDRSLTIFGAQTVDGQFKRETRQFKINFSYRFGNKQLKSSSNRASGVEEEIKRSQNGGG